MGLSLAVGVAALAVAPASEALAKEVCCYRVHVNTSNQLHVEDHGGTKPGAQNGTYDVSSQWAVRELMIFNTKRYGDAHFNRVRTRNQNSVPGAARFEGSESSSQSYIDSNGNRVDYPPCRFSQSVPWRRTGGAGNVNLFRAGPDAYPYFVTNGGTVARDYPGCDNTAPYFGASSGWAYPHRDPHGGVSAYPGDSYWDAFGSTIRTAHTPDTIGPIFKKLKKMKDQVVTFEPPSQTGTSQLVGPHTYTVTHRTVIRFSWFPYDRLQKELNELNGLK
jgi:hypothetical protein